MIILNLITGEDGSEYYEVNRFTGVVHVTDGVQLSDEAELQTYILGEVPVFENGLQLLPDMEGVPKSNAVEAMSIILADFSNNSNYPKRLTALQKAVESLGENAPAKNIAARALLDLK